MEKEESVVRAKFGYMMYENDGYRICRYDYIDRPADARRKSFIAKGKDLPVIKDVVVVLHGKWVPGKETGTLDMNVVCFETELPTEEEGVVNYICSLHCGVGKSKATSLYKRFGFRTWNILQNQPERVRELGWPMALIDKLCKALRQTQLQSQIMQLFGEISFHKANALVDKFGDQALFVLQNSPYEACKVEGFSFAVVDQMALRRGVDPTNIERRKAAAAEALDALSVSGHSCIPRGVLIQKMMSLLNPKTTGQVVNEEMCDSAIVVAIHEKSLVNIKGIIYSMNRYVEERRITKDIARLMKSPSENVDFASIDDILKQYEQENGLDLANSQKEAVKCAMLNKVSILTGGPGTGKTTTTKAILYCHKMLFKAASRPVLLSPTGKAARRMAESTGYPASTIHSGLKICAVVKKEGNGDGDDEKPSGADVIGEGSMLTGNLILVDECSMADQYITSELLHNVPSGARVVFIGDPDQLPSVGCGNVLYEFIRSKVIPCVKLSVIFRQAQDNPIVGMSYLINTGQSQAVRERLLGQADPRFSLRRTSGDLETFRTAGALYIKAVRKYGLESTLLLCPFRKSTAINVNLFNLQLQAVLNPKREGAPVMKGKPLFVGAGKAKPLEFRKGDKVMMTVNTNDARNGDTGYIRDIVKVINKSDPTRYALVAMVEFNEDGIIHEMDAEKIRDLDLAYCTTVHKAQGSEADNVIMVMTMRHKLMLQRKLFYTGVTRAKKNVLLVGDEAAVEYAIENDSAERRYTLLGDWLHHELGAKKTAA